MDAVETFDAATADGDGTDDAGPSLDKEYCEGCGQPLGGTDEYCYGCGGEKTHSSRFTGEQWRALLVGLGGGE